MGRMGGRRLWEATVVARDSCRTGDPETSGPFMVTGEAGFRNPDGYAGNRGRHGSLPWRHIVPVLTCSVLKASVD